SRRRAAGPRRRPPDDRRASPSVRVRLLELDHLAAGEGEDEPDVRSLAAIHPALAERPAVLLDPAAHLPVGVELRRLAVLERLLEEAAGAVRRAVEGEGVGGLADRLGVGALAGR